MTRRAVVLALALVVSLTACGIPTDDDATVIAPDQLPQSLVESATTTTSTVTPPARGDVVALFYVADNHLAFVPVEVASAPTLAEVLTALTSGPSDAVASAGYRSALATSDPVLRSVTLERGVAMVDLTDTFAESPVADQVLGLGQIVMTATSRPGVGQVRFTLEGEPVEVPRADGSIGPGTVSRDDYDALLTPQ